MRTSRSHTPGPTWRMCGREVVVSPWGRKSCPDLGCQGSSALWDRRCSWVRAGAQVCAGTKSAEPSCLPAAEVHYGLPSAPRSWSTFPSQLWGSFSPRPYKLPEQMLTFSNEETMRGTAAVIWKGEWRVGPPKSGPGVLYSCSLNNWHG